MKKTRHIIVAIALLVSGGLLAAVSVVTTQLAAEMTPGVKAAGSTVTVQVGPMPDVCPNIAGNQATVPNGMIIDESGDCVTPPPDVCPNIAGPQASVPDGMIVDGSGNCVTPPPPDACPNIDGFQSAVPAGYYQDESGNCVQQTTPPQDVCPNIAGTQAVVPAGKITDSAGNCVDPAVDECANIPGDQGVVPAGMERDEKGECYTPATQPTPDPPAAPPVVPPSTTRRDPPKNIPAFLAPVVQPLIDLVPESIKEAVKNVPPEVARTFPYYIFVILGLVAGQMMWQAIRETVAAKRFYAILKREKEIAEEKDNFIALSSHYLHTPITVMSNGVDVINSLKELPDGTTQPLMTAIAELKTKIDGILSDVDDNKALRGIKAPDIGEARVKMLASPYFWIPIITAGVLTLLANFLLGVVAEVDLGIGNLWGQVIVFIGVSFMLYSTLRTRHLRRKERENAEKLILHEQTIDAARNSFIQQSTQVLREGLRAVETQRPLIASAPSIRFFDEGYQRFTSILAKFTLLSSIESGAQTTTTTFNIRDAVEDSLTLHQPQIIEKGLTINNQVDDLAISQNRVLFGFVLNSVIDNAIKFSNQSGEITIAAKPVNHTLDITISDTGIGIAKEKLPQLFKPFSRATSAIQFDYEGMGFSLFLGKIIMDYLGGDISATSSENGGTTIQLTSALTEQKTQSHAIHSPLVPAR